MTTTGDDDDQPVEPATLAPTHLLDYRPPPPPRPPRWAPLCRWLARLGPLWPQPSIRTVLLGVVLVAAIFGLSLHSGEWRAGRSRAVTNLGGFGNWPDGFVAMPGRDAILSVDTNGEPIVWRPWDNKVLARCTGAPTAAQRVACSGDESCILSQTGDGLYLWRTSDGSRIHQLLGGNAPFLPVGNTYAAAISPDGARLATLSHHADLAADELAIWDLTGPRATSAVHRGLDGRMSMNHHLEFAPDGRHLLLMDRDNVRLLDAATLAPMLQCHRNDYEGRPAAWANGGRQLMVAERGATYGQGVLSVYNCDDGRPLRQVALPEFTPSTIVPSPDGSRVAVVADHFGAGACVDLIPATPLVRRHSPLSFPTWGDVRFFADGRRAVVSSWWGIDPVVVDLVTGHHLGTLPLPPSPTGFWNPQPPTVGLAISADEQHIAARLGNGTVQVFDRTGPDSAWGIAGSTVFPMVAVALALLLWSVHRDAAEELLTARRHPAATMVVACSFPALLYICGAAALGHWSDPYWVNRHWVALTLALWLPAGLGVRGGSPLWNAFARLLLLACAGLVPLCLSSAGSISGQPFRALDRTVFLPTALVASLAAVTAGASIGLLTLLVWGRPVGSPKLPVDL